MSFYSKPGSLYLGGGGGKEDSLPMDTRIAHLVPHGRPILYLPLALDPRWHPYESCYAWISSVFNPLGVANITMWESLQGKTATDLTPFAAVYIGGGNTYKLLHDVRAAGFDVNLRDYWENGGIIAGGSAGAILLGRDIETAAYLGDQNAVGVENTGGLDLLQGYSVWPHYQEAHGRQILAFVQEHQHPVIALPERAGACILGNTAESVAFEPVIVFRGSQQILVPPSSTCPLD